ncbi:MAG: nucleotidyltransferase substrate binding protein [Gallionella sp.]|nr:nucleotidyltransferase substrate binding protein [Gallionella sp.]
MENLDKHLDIRWQQRLNQYQKALAQLSEAVELSRERVLSRIERQGLIKAFEFTHELAWNVMKDFFVWQGNAAITGSRDATREAFARNLVVDGESWMAMIQSRNQSSHTYNEETANEITQQVVNTYHALFQAFADRMEALKNVG